LRDCSRCNVSSNVSRLITTVEETDGADGAAGTVVAVTVAAEEAAEVPALLVAVTVIEYCTLEARPVTVIGEDAPVAVLVV